MLDSLRAARPFQGPASAAAKVAGRRLPLLDMGVSKDDDYARTSMRLTLWGCIAGLAVILAIPVYMLVAFVLYGMPTP